MKNIAAKLVKAMSEIDAVTKKGKNEKQGYAYVRAADVANEVRSVLVKHGIAFSYHVAGEKHWDAETKTGTVMYFCSLQVNVQFIDSESGESMLSSVIGWGFDMGDKAPYKAMTGALKYAMRMNFIIPDESDPENEQHNEEIVKSVKRQQNNPADKDELEWSYNKSSGVLICRPIDVQIKTKANKETFVAIKLNQKLLGDKDMIFCWHKSVQEVLSAAKGKICKFVVSQDAKQFWSLDEVLEIDGKKFEPSPQTVAEQTWESLIMESKTIDQFNTLPALVNGDVDRANVLSQAAADRGYTWNKTAKQFEEHV